MTRRPGQVPRKTGRRQIALKDRLAPVLISLVSVVVVFGAVAWFVGSAPQWPRIQLQFFSVDAMLLRRSAVCEWSLIIRCANCLTSAACDC